MTQPCPNTETFQKKTYINIDINTSKNPNHQTMVEQ